MKDDSASPSVVGTGTETSPLREVWWMYTAALILPLATLAARISLGKLLGNDLGLIVFTIPIILSAYWGGLKPGLLATLVSCAGASYYLLPPYHSFSVADSATRWQVASVIVSGAFISVICGHLHRSQDRARKAVGDLKGKETELQVALKEAEDLRSALDEHAIVAITDPRGRITFVNDKFCAISKFPRKELIGKDHRIINSGFHPREFMRELWETIGSGKVWHGEIKNKAKDGSVYWVDTTIVPFTDSDDRIRQYVAIRADITERKQAEEIVRQSDDRFRELAENINEVFWMVDPTRKKMLYISPAYERIWGQSTAHLYDAPEAWLDAVHQEDRERVLQAAREKQAAGTYDEEYRIVRPDNEVRWIHDRAVPIRNQEGEVYHIIGTAEDVTVRKRFEEQNRQRQKLESIGQLAGGVAHDFNNLLAVIQVQAELIQMDGPLASGQQDSLNEIKTTVDRAASLTRQLLLFSRREIFQPSTIDLSKSIVNTAKMLRRVLGETIRMQIKLAPEPMVVYADASMMDQVVLNLAVNARDAMPEGGRLVIETSAAEFDEFSPARSPQTRPGNYVCLSVSDDGTGIPPEVLPRIFEPFFTTKDIGKGTGLGLATVFGVVQQHQGWVNVYSEVGLGTTFRVYLPRLEGVVAPAARTGTKTPSSTGSETILLVEDDPSLRMSLRKALAQLGYQILEASTAAEAIRIWEKHRDRIHLLLTDLVMPGGTTGKDLAQRLRKEARQLKVICMSGYSAEVVGTDEALPEGVQFLTKPFQAGQLARLIREILDG